MEVWDPVKPSGWAVPGQALQPPASQMPHATGGRTQLCPVTAHVTLIWAAACEHLRKAACAVKIWGLGLTHCVTLGLLRPCL